MTRAIIGLDIGTSAVKAEAFALACDGRHAAPRAAQVTSSTDLRMRRPDPGWEVQDTDTLLAAVDAVLRDCVARCADLDLVALSVSTAMHALIGLDGSGQPLTPVITWADSRATDEAARIADLYDPIRLLHDSGTPVHPMSPMVKLRWMITNEPDLSAKARHWIGLKELVMQHLTGRLVAELSCASGTGLLSLATRQWDPAAAEVAGIDLDQLPELVDTTTRFPLSEGAAKRSGLLSGLPVVIGAGDGPLGNLGTGAITSGVVGLSCGTSGAARMALPEPTMDTKGRLFCYALTQDLWVAGGAISNGGSAVRWAAETFAPAIAGSAGDRNDAQILELAAQAPPGCDGLVILPYVLAERSPLDPDLPALITGLRRHHAPQHFIRATLEGVCRQLAGIVASLNSVAPVKSVRATGAPFESALWRTVLAAHLDHPLIVASSAGGTAMGAAALGAYALGLADTLPAALTLVGGHTAEDDPTEPVLVETGAAAIYRSVPAALDPLLEEYGAVADAWLGD